MVHDKGYPQNSVFDDNVFFAIYEYKTINISITLLQLLLSYNASQREIIIQFRILSRTWYSDKWNSSKSFSKEEGDEKFKVIANSREFLIENSLFENS